MVNHCVTEQISQFLSKKLYELNCNLHPLDGIAVAARKALLAYDKKQDVTSNVYGSECRAANLVQAISKLRYFIFCFYSDLSIPRKNII